MHCQFKTALSRMNPTQFFHCLFALNSFVSSSLADERATDVTIHGGGLAGERHRVVVSTDIGGTDPDDFQSMVHLLVYADVLDIEGLISSPYGPGRREHLLQVIDCYEQDYPKLKSYSEKYPTPDSLRSMTKQGQTERAPFAGVSHATAGSEWIIRCARRNDPRPLHLLVWGGLEDLAQALHDAPDILPKLRVYWIGGPNKKWSPDAYQYLVENHPTLWIIESNSTYRGWFAGGNQVGEWGNKSFVAEHIAGRGALGDFFVRQMDRIKMGDTPSVGWLLNGSPSDPRKSGWGGTYVRAWERPHLRLDRMPTQKDRIEVFGILEIVLPLRESFSENVEAHLKVDNQQLPGEWNNNGSVSFRFCPKSAKTFRFKIQFRSQELEELTGGITAFAPQESLVEEPTARLPNWWADDLTPERAEGVHHGARSVSRWRKEFLSDFAKRMQRCN